MSAIKWPEYRNKILAELDNETFFLTSLNNVQRRGAEVKAECPFVELHENSTDKTPSLTVNIHKGTYICQTCKSKGNAHTLHKFINKLSSEQAWFDLGDALKVERPDSSKPARPEIDDGLISQYHQALMNLSGPLRDILRDRRGYTDETLVRFQLGWDGERVTIPVYDEHNLLVNFRRYKWNSEEDQYKVINYQDELGNLYGEVRVFGIENLVNENIEEIVWCEGETDRILAEQFGFPTACPTSGAGAWRPEWLSYFRGKKRVYLVQDNDEAGRIATKKLCEKLGRTVELYIINWPEDFPAKGDITDYFIKNKMTADDFRALLNQSTRYIDPLLTESVVDETEAVNVHLSLSASAKLYGKRIQVPVMVSGKDTTPLIAPRKVKASCGDKFDSENKRCANCGLCENAGEMTRDIKSVDVELLTLVSGSQKNQMDTLTYMMGINPKCPFFTIEVLERMNLEEVRMIPKADTAFGFSTEHEYVVRSGFYIGENIKANKKYTMVGYMYPDPATQRATYLFDKAYAEKDLINDFDMTADTFEQLKRFQVAEGQTIMEKFEEIHKDLERNVTYIWERRDVAFAVDLVYHSVLNFYFQKQYVKRGWVELLVIGDSGQAKTTLIENLMAHYRVGEMHSGESSKRTGLIYSLQQTNKRWFLVWGAYPLNDGGLIAIDELSGLPEDDLALMSDVRSSGIAKTTGVVTAETTARTRGIFISNARNGRQLNTETHGVSAVLKLFGKAEDVRRLDMALAVASGDVDESYVNMAVDDMPEVLHVYDSDLCNMRVLWAWSRRPEHINFEPEAVTAILAHATAMGRRYSSKIPIVEAADQRIKIARLSISAACCVFSTEDGQNVIVKKDHVDFVVEFLNKIYSSKSLGYDKFSDLDRNNSDTSDTNIDKLVQQFMIIGLSDHNEIVNTLYTLTYFSRNTLEDFTGLQRDDLKGLLKFLTTNHLVEKVRGDYRRLPLGTEFLEHLRANPITRETLAKVRQDFYTSEY